MPTKLTEDDKQEVREFCSTWGGNIGQAKGLMRKLLREIERLKGELRDRTEAIHRQAATIRRLQP